MSLHAKLSKVQSIYVLCSMKQRDIIENMKKVSIQQYFIQKNLNQNQYMKIKTELLDDLHLQKTLTMHNLEILIDSVSNENHNQF